MEDDAVKGLGALSALGGVLAVVATVPSRWYGVPDTDAYVFDPRALTPLWIERSVMPVVAALAAVLVLAGVAGLVLRDRPVAGRLRRWSGYAALAGLGPFALVLVVDAATAGSVLSDAGSPLGAITLLVAFLVAVAGIGLAMPALVAMGVGYARTDRPAVGYALIAGPLLSASFFFGGWVADFEAVGGLPVVVPVAAAFVVAGNDLWTRTDPLAASGDCERRSGAETAPEGDGSAADSTDTDGSREP